MISYGLNFKSYYYSYQTNCLDGWVPQDLEISGAGHW